MSTSAAPDGEPSRLISYQAAPPPTPASRAAFSKGAFGHLSLGVSDLYKATIFYDACLAPIGLTRTYTDFPAQGAEWDGEVGYGLPGGNDFIGIKLQPKGAVVGGAGTHIAFNAPSREAVHEFYIAAIANGGVDDGPPGLRRNYGEHYYAAFVRDPDGWRIEAVFQQPI
ncbi:hypothetical protein HDU86_001759 [Geranomyces michiganensis]|nr:hypothetical protein HDU86_001759 [Geranomyces michiganensis]